MIGNADVVAPGIDYHHEGHEEREGLRSETS